MSINTKLRGHIIAVLYNYYTKPGICNLVVKAINMAISLEKARYICNNWLKTLSL
jgi:hypothetical protein